MVGERALVAQWGRPSGMLGRLAGWEMAQGKGASLRLVVELLELRDDDRVLEVGFGPGLALEAIGARVPAAGLVEGVDHSEVMVRQAARRNAPLIRAGRVRVRLGDAASLPYPDGRFTRALAAHSLPFWAVPARGLGELARVLAPGGRAVVLLRVRRGDEEPLEEARYGGGRRLGDLLERARGAAFASVRCELHELRRRPVAALVALR